MQLIPSRIHWPTGFFVLFLLGDIAVSGLAFHARVYWDAVLLLLTGVCGFALLYMGFSRQYVTMFLTLIGIHMLVGVMIILAESDQYRNFLSKAKGRKLYLRDVVIVTSPVFSIFLIALTIYMYRAEQVPRVLRDGVLVKRDSVAPVAENEPLIENFL